MTHDAINERAYDEARRAFISMMLYEGYRLETANEKRAEIYEASKRSRCTKCLLEKHVSQFWTKDGDRAQSWCIQCGKEYSKMRHSTPYQRPDYAAA